ncbi:MAG TPA: hypothetical protein VL442_19225 [Mucilaginibacter sp.]|jgi:hypothetical protein|nr:hypothetical protein [Mucilaginibacter sp.]
MKALKVFLGIFFVIIGVLFFVFLRALNDPDIEGESGRIGFGAYLISFSITAIGLTILFFKRDNKD